jgi:predicted DNA-binding protein YlxM (UPF0122 family)
VDCARDCTKEKQKAVIHSLWAESMTGFKNYSHLLSKGKICYLSDECMNGLKFSRMSEQVSLTRSAHDDRPRHPNDNWEKVNVQLCYGPTCILAIVTRTHPILLQIIELTLTDSLIITHQQMHYYILCLL